MMEKASQENQDDVSISIIPEELHMFILSRLDGPSLVMAKRTCKMWACLIENLEKHFHIWLMCCLKEIPLYTLTEIMGYKQLKIDNDNLVRSFRKLPWMFWREIYAEYQRGCMVGWASSQLVELFYKQSHSMVTALAIHDGRLITGHEDGSVFSWKNTVSDGLDLDLIHKHERRVTSVSVSSTCLDVTELLTHKPHTLVVTGSQDYGIFISDLTSKRSAIAEYYNKQINSVSCFGPYLTSAASGSLVQGQSVWYTSTEDGLSVSKEFKLEGTLQSNMMHSVLTEDMVYMIDDKGCLYRWIRNAELPTKPEKVFMFSSPVSSFLYKENCIVCLLENGDLVVLNEKEQEVKKCDVYGSVQKKPECMAWRGQVFALGMKGGVVYLYFVRDVEDFKNFDVTKPVRKLSVDGGHVNHIAIGDDGNCPLVAIATEHLQLFLFRFHR